MTKEVCYRIISKKVLRNPTRHVFIICSDNDETFIRSSFELYQDKIILDQMSSDDVYNIGFTRGVEWILESSQLKK
jgi:hypothetical protein